MLRNILATISLFVLLGSSHAGPFGLDMGMSLNRLKQLGSVTSLKSANMYKIENLREVHPDFETYTIMVSPKLGLCKIRAIGQTFRNDSYGTEMKQKFDSLSRAISNKYGPPKDSHDFLKHSSIWKEPREWMMALLKNERILTTFWTDGLPDNLDGIMLDTNGLSMDSGFIDLIYEFKNYSACKEERNTTTNRNL
jgi:hypothetical protein